MALVDDIEFYGYAVASGEMDRATAGRLLVESAAGGLTAAGADSLIDNWQTARGLFEQEVNRATAGLDRINERMGL